jgi:hypothetical protein
MDPSHPSASTRRRPWQLAAVAVLFVVGLMNWRHPVLRFAWQPLNQAVLLAVLALPVVAIVMALGLRPRWIAWSVSLALLLPAAVAAVLALFTVLMLGDTLITGQDPSFTHVRDVPVAASTLRVYRTNGGATTNYGAVVRQERTLAPGVRLVRVVYRAYPAYDVRIALDSPGRASFDGRPPVVLQPAVWF